MSRVLTAPVVDAAPRPLGVPLPALDARTRALVEEATADAYARGCREGRAEGAAQARADLARATGAVVAALDAAVAECRALRAVAADGDIVLASEIAEAVIGRTPHDGGAALLDRTREALALLDDRPLVVRATPPDVAALAAGLADVSGLVVEPDSSLQLGEARVVGRWGTADLTRVAAWEAIRDALAGDRAPGAAEHASPVDHGRGSADADDAGAGSRAAA